MKPGDVVEAVWDDHCFVFKDYGGEGPMRIRTCGYFVREDEKVLCLSLSLANDKPNDVQVIDKRMLLSRKKVR